MSDDTTAMSDFTTAMSDNTLAREAARQLPPGNDQLARSDALEDKMLEQLGVKVKLPWAARVDRPAAARASGRYLMGDDPRLPKMPPAPTLEDFFKLRLALDPGAMSHLLQSARLARQRGESDNIVLACLLHDISVICLMRADHGYWAAQLVAPYVDEEVAWSIAHHQPLRYFASPAHGYEYPAFYREVFGEDFVVPEYLNRDRASAMKHRWYESAMAVVVNDFYAFDPDVQVKFEEFEDVVGRAFRQPKEGLGFDNSPVAHMWRTIIWPNNFL